MNKKCVITIARGFGSGGRTIGKALADELGINYYDKELLKLVSQSTGINEQMFSQVDEKLKGTVIWKVAQNVYRGENLGKQNEDYSMNISMFNYTARVLTEIAKRESCVVIGRCADYILRGNENVIRIFVHASEDTCVRNVSEKSSMTDSEIRQFIEKTDRNRAEYYKYFTGGDWKDATNYDLCIDTDKMTVRQSIDVIKAYMKVRYMI